MVTALKVPLMAVEKSSPKSTVCVTGAGGYVASHVVHRLLSTGHTVHAAVRSSGKASHLRSLPGAAGRLRFFEGCDLTVPGSFDAAVAGCDYVMHMASPFTLNVNPAKVQDTLLRPAVDGTKNVLASVDRAPSVRRVVLTSSIAAILAYPEEGRVYDETMWNDQASESEFAYELSKTLAERAAWEAAGKQDRWSLVVINPGLVMGPPLGSRADGESIHLMQRIMRGDMVVGYPDFEFRSVDVRDVAKAHCVAMVKEDARGRHLVAPHRLTFGRVRDVLRSGPLGGRLWWRLPTRPLPRWLLMALADVIDIERYRIRTSCGVPLNANCSKAEATLGMSWLPDDVTYNDMALAMAGAGLAPGGVPASSRAVAPAPFSEEPASPVAEQERTEVM